MNISICFFLTFCCPHMNTMFLFFSPVVEQTWILSFYTQNVFVFLPVVFRYWLHFLDLWYITSWLGVTNQPIFTMFLYLFFLPVVFRYWLHFLDLWYITSWLGVTNQPIFQVNYSSPFQSYHHYQHISDLSTVNVEKQYTNCNYYTEMKVFIHEKNRNPLYSASIPSLSSWID
jgi:hypothetical protein